MTLEIQPLTKNDLDTVINMCIEAFGAFETKDEIRTYLMEQIDVSISKKDVLGSHIVGCYLFNKASIYDFMQDNPTCALSDLSSYKDKQGIQGVALVVRNSFKGKGIGKLLRDVPKSMNVDYIWGKHLSDLGNIQQWVQYGRKIVGNGIVEDEHLIITLMDL